MARTLVETLVVAPVQTLARAPMQAPVQALVQAQVQAPAQALVQALLPGAVLPLVQIAAQALTGASRKPLAPSCRQNPVGEWNSPLLTASTFW